MGELPRGDNPKKNKGSGNPRKFGVAIQKTKETEPNFNTSSIPKYVLPHFSGLMPINKRSEERHEK